MNNPYFYRPQPSSVRAADDVFKKIDSTPDWKSRFSQGKMLGVLVYSREPFKYLCAYSGVVNGLEDPDHYFVPAVYDLQNPDDFYLQKDASISEINSQIASLTLKMELATSAQDNKAAKKIAQQIEEQKTLRKQMSIALQKEIFTHFNLINPTGRYKNIVDVFADARRGLPPGGTGECAAIKLLQYALQHHLEPLEIAEFWYGASPRVTPRSQGQFYPSCIEKCSPLLSFMTEGLHYDVAPDAESPVSIDNLDIIYEDEYLLVVDKPSGVLSVPGKIEGDSVEAYLHREYPQVKGPMLVHRLDQSTSGLLLAAKDAYTHKRLQLDFEGRKIHKEYVARLEGRLPSKCGIINLPICPNPDDRPRQIVDYQFGKKAITFYQTIKYEEGYTLVRFVPLTGRTHQLRMHAASQFGLGHPIVGDRIYCGRQFERLMLHAITLTFTHPITGKEIHIVTKAFE